MYWERTPVPTLFANIAGFWTEELLFLRHCNCFPTLLVCQHSPTKHTQVPRLLQPVEAPPLQQEPRSRFSVVLQAANDILLGGSATSIPVTVEDQQVMPLMDATNMYQYKWMQ